MAPALCFSGAFEDAFTRLRTFRLTAWDIADALGLARSTVAHVLKRPGLNRRDRLDPPQPVRHYERKRPGDPIHLDIKKLGRFAQMGLRPTLQLIATTKPLAAQMDANLQLRKTTWRY